MSADEDKKFDAVVAGYVHRTLHEQTARIHCPQTDVLAAYHERSLSPEEMSGWKAHIAACSHCQEVLKSLEATEGILLEASREEEAAAMRAGAVPPRAAAPAEKAQEIPWVRRKPPFAYWRTLAPLGAIAAGLLMWIAIRESNLHTRPIEVAENRAPAVLSNPPAAQAPASREETDKNQAEPRPAEPAINGVAKTQTGVETYSQLPKEKKEMSPGSDLGAAVGGSGGRLESPAAHQPMIGALRQRNQSAPLAGGQVADEAQMKSVPPPPPPMQSNATSEEPAKLAPAFTAGKPSAPAAVTETVEVTSGQGSVAAGAATGSVEAERKDSLSKQKTASRDAAMQAGPGPANALPINGQHSNFSPSRVIPAPGGKVIWSVGVGGQILHSVDGGKTWHVQDSSVTTTLTAGAAPSESMCWIVGIGGIVLRTTDGGTHWMRVSSPPSTDLIGISATDADHAVLWTSLPAVRYATNDGGKTWFVPNK